MSDAAYFSAFSEPPLGAHARRLRSIDREGEEKRYKRTDRERERERERGGRGGEREEVERDGKGKFYYTSGRNPFSYTVSRIL
jgi:hypothetical protein